jgi:hypothetical protein
MDHIRKSCRCDYQADFCCRKPHLHGVPSSPLSSRLLWISKLFLKNINFFIKKIVIIFLNTPLPTYSLLIEVGFQNIVVETLLETSQFLVFV